MRRMTIALLALFAAACTCGKPDSGPGKAPVATGPKELTEAEPNDAVASAMPLREAARVTAELKADPAKADEDLYRVEAQGTNKQASLEVTGIPAVDLSLEVLDRDGNHVAVFNSEGEGKGERIPNLGLAAPWIVKVFAAKKGSGGAYTLTLALEDRPQDAEIEPNDRAVDATQLALGRPLKGLVGDRADEDWFKFEVPVPGAAPGAPPTPPTPTPTPAPPAPPAPTPSEPGTPAPAPAATPPAPPAPPATTGEPGAPPPPPPVLPVDAPDSGVPSTLPTAVVKLEVSGVPDVRLQVEVSNQAQAVFYTARSREPGEGIQVRNLALRPGETSYFVTVKSAWTGSGKDAKRTYNAGAPYTVAITPEEAGSNAELEPNDEAGKATPVPGEGTKIGYFAPKGDLDYYVVRCEKPVLLKAELSGVDRVDSTLALVKPDPDVAGKEETLLKANDGGIREGELLVNVGCGPGMDAVLRVEAAPRQVEGKWVRDQENPDEPYRLTVTARPDVGDSEREPNGTPATATPLELGKTIKGHVHPKRDVDDFAIDLTKSPVKVALRASVTGILKVDVALALFRIDGDPATAKPTLVQRSEKAKGESPESIKFTVEPGLYVVEVRDTKNLQSNFMDAYQLTVEQEQ